MRADDLEAYAWAGYRTLNGHVMTDLELEVLNYFKKIIERLSARH